MGPALHAGNPNGSSATCTCRLFGFFKPEFGGNTKREPRLGSPLPMGPALHVGNPNGSSATCNCRHCWAHQA
eukprot:1278112-Pyramimonas_sp.AAC.1